MDYTESFNKLHSYCKKESFIGWDPYDGLNSKLFQRLLLNKWDLARLLWIQLFKRNPINLRTLFGVDKGYNPKAIALFISGYCNLYKMDPKIEYLNKIESLSKILISLKNSNYSGSCWGYNFDWQARGGLYFPSGTPNIVVTTFCSTALINAYEILKREELLHNAISSANFIIHDLNRSIKEEWTFIFLFTIDGK